MFYSLHNDIINIQLTSKCEVEKNDFNVYFLSGSNYKF